MSLVELKKITKRFPGVLANDRVDLTLHPGEVHGLLGENGAGKTTLMNILFGLYRPDEGEIWIDGKAASFHSPADAISRGIGMVHQHFKLVQPFSVTENVILGMPGSFFIDQQAAQAQVAAVAEKYGLKIDPAARIQQLSVGEQQRVEILSSLYRGAEVLILDEPTAVLTPQEAEILSDGLRKMAGQGKSIVFISHKLEEVLKLTQRVTVLRSGRVVFSAMTNETNKAELAREMIGHDLASLHGEQKASILALAGAEQAAHLEEAKQAQGPKEVILQVENLSVLDERGLLAVQGMNLTLHAGEILGIAGVDGNGQHELVEAIARLRPIQSGRLIIQNQEATHWQTHDFINYQASYITDDRQHEGLILDFDLGKNATLKIFEKPPFSKKGLLQFENIRAFTQKLISDFDVRAPGPAVNAATLSGGNQQKLILARELSQAPHLILANKPTRGLDIGAAAYINQKLLDERDKGNAILLISADLDELLLLSDRILVMYNGHSMGVLQAGQAEIQKIGLMMAGTPLAELTAQEVNP